MQVMHTKLPDFYAKIKAAATKLRPETGFKVSGLEQVECAKLASLRCGRVEDEIFELTQDEEITDIEVKLTTFNPELFETVIIKGYTKDKRCKKAILENMMVSTPTVEYYLYDAEEIDDRRSGNRQ